MDDPAASKPPKRPWKRRDTSPESDSSGLRNDTRKSAWAQVARYSAIGMTIPSHLFAGWLLGTVLDRVFSTDYLYIVFVLIGAVSGFIEMIRLATRNLD